MVESNFIIFVLLWLACIIPSYILIQLYTRLDIHSLKFTDPWTKGVRLFGILVSIIPIVNLISILIVILSFMLVFITNVKFLDWLKDKANW